MTRTIHLATLIALLAMIPAPPADAQASMRLRYDRALEAGAAWGSTETNEAGTLTWGTSYALMSMLELYEATKEPRYLETFRTIADATLEQRDSVRGVRDYTGTARPCWQAGERYSTRPYCWAVHSGMIGYPLARFARVVQGEEARLGSTFGEDAARYLQAAIDAAAVHQAEFRTSGADQGYYIFESAASFLPAAGDPMPLNQMNALGRLHAELSRVVSDPLHRERARRMANYFLRWTTTTGAGGYAWNYQPTAYRAPGEDISHAAIEVGFARAAADAGIVFDDTHLQRFAWTAFRQIYVDTAGFYDHVGGSGALNTSSYRPQFARWAWVAPVDPRIHASARANLSTLDTTTSGSLLLGMGLIAVSDVPQRAFRFYRVDWEELGETRRATAHGANILFVPDDPAARYLVPIRYRAARRTSVQQWDGERYHEVAKLAATGAAFATTYIPYDPALHFDYDDGVLFQFDDAFVAGQGIEVGSIEIPAPPRIVSTAPTDAVIGEPSVYAPEVESDGDVVWELETELPIEAARIDPRTGELAFTLPGATAVTMTLRVRNDGGADEQLIQIAPRAALADAGAGVDGGTDETNDGGHDVDAATGAREPVGGSCSCRVGRSRGPGGLGPALALAFFMLRRARRS